MFLSYRISQGQRVAVYMVDRDAVHMQFPSVRENACFWDARRSDVLTMMKSESRKNAQGQTMVPLVCLSVWNGARTSERSQ